MISSQASTAAGPAREAAFRPLQESPTHWPPKDEVLPGRETWHVMEQLTPEQVRRFMHALQRDYDRKHPVRPGPYAGREVAARLAEEFPADDPRFSS